MRVTLYRSGLRFPSLTGAGGSTRAVAATGILELWRKGRKRDPTTNFGAGKLKERARLVDLELEGG